MIGIYNVEKNMAQKLSESLEICELSIGDINFPKVDGIIIDYIDKNNYKERVHQAALIEKYIKNTKIVIFDRHFSVTNKELNWLKRFNIKLFEPAMNNRSDFQYLPYWVDNISIDWMNNNKRNIHLAYSNKDIEDKLKYFEKYYRNYAKIFPNRNVCYSTNKLNDKKKKDYENDNLHFLKMFNYKDVSFNIAIDNKRNYEIGYLDENIWNLLKYGCVPILPKEHKYFHALFGDLVIKNIEDIDYITSMPDISNVLIEEILQNLNNLYPEFLIDNVAEVLINCFK